MNFPLRARYALFTAAFAIPSIIFTPAAVHAATSGITALTLTVDSVHGGTGGVGVPGYLMISAPASLNLGSVAFPQSYLVSLGTPISVTDGRTISLGWSSSVVMSALTPTLGGAVIPATVFAYDPGVITHTGGTVTGYLPSDLSAGAGVNVVSTVGSHIAANWFPTISVNVTYAPADGAYTGTMTSSVV